MNLIDKFKGSLPIIAFIGWHNSGKTTLVRRVAKELKERSYIPAIIKSTKHRDIILDTQGTDTYLYRKDGVPFVALVSPDEIDLFMENSNEPVETLAHRFFPQADIVLCEGFKNHPSIPKIEVTRKDFVNRPLRDVVNNVIATVADFDLDVERLFKLEEVEKLCDFIEDTFLRPSDGEDVVTLFINGIPVDLNNFVRNALKGTVRGFIGSLKSTEDAKDITIHIRLK